MSREATILLILTIVLFGGLAGWGVAQGQGAAAGPAVEALSDELTRLRADLGRQGDQLRSFDGSLDDRLRRLELDVHRLDRDPLDVPAAVAPEVVLPGAEPGPETPAAAHASDAESVALRDEFAALLALDVLDENTVATADQQARFWELARTTPALAELIAELEGRTAESPADVDARLELADAYVAKLLTVPAGPERGAWGMKAEQQWTEALVHDPDNWEARFALAENFSYYPEFLNKTGEALAGLLQARAIQERLPPEARHAKTYVLLSRMHARQGDDAAAREVLMGGLQRHPGDASLQAALQALDS